MSLFNSLHPPIRAVILDMDGVLWKDKTPICDLPAVFRALKEKNIRVMFATNNATRNVAQYLEKLMSMGVFAESQQIVNSSMALGHILIRKFPSGGNLYIIGEPGLILTLAEFGFHHSEEKVLAVVAGLDRTFSYEKARKATLLIRNQGIPFYGTNPDRSFPSPDGETPGAGAVLAMIETASDTPPIIAGKPEPIMYQIALDRLGLKPEETLAVGDRLDTDILGGQKAGCRTALVLSGISNLDDLEKWHPKPDIIAQDLQQLILS